jgi:hypothetical protein
MENKTARKMVPARMAMKMKDSRDAKKGEDGKNDDGNAAILSE